MSIRSLRGLRHRALIASSRVEAVVDLFWLQPGSGGPVRTGPLSRRRARLHSPSTTLGMSDPQQEIADVEAEIEALTQAADRCRKVIVLSKVATGAGGLMLVVILTG